MQQSSGSVRNNKIQPAKQSKTGRKRGMFITLEGGEGAGKSSQMKHLKAKLEALGHTVITTREPGGSSGGEAVRHVLLSGAAEPLGADMEAILFSASRADHVDTIIEPNLKAGNIVISDRFFDSTRVYQGVSGKVSPDFVRQLERIACGPTWPDITIIIDLDPKEGMARASKRRAKSESPDRYEKESIKLQTMRRKAYLKIAKDEPDRCVVIDGSGSEKAVFNRLWKAIEKHFVTQTKSPKTTNKNKTKKTKLLPHKKLTAKNNSATGKRQSK